jgi:hypothetical protein
MGSASMTDQATASVTGLTKMPACLKHSRPRITPAKDQ